MTIRVENLRKRFKGKAALDGLTFDAADGEVFGFIGPNGAGKTTTMRILAGLITYDSGLCELGGSPPGRLGSGKRSRTGYLPEEPMFADSLTAREYLGLIVGSMEPGGARAEVRRLLSMVSLEAVADRRIAGFSRGMRQRLGLACALAGDPELLILDEPSSALDPEGRKDVVELVRGLKAAGKTVFVSSHILSDIERVCDRIALVDKGKIVLEGSIREILDDGGAMIMDIAASRDITESERSSLRAWEPVGIVSGEGANMRIGFRKGIDVDASRTGLLRELSTLGIPVVSLHPVKASLEELFLEKVGRHA